MTAEMDYATAAYLHALRQMEKVGRATALKLLDAFPSSADFACAVDVDLVRTLGPKVADHIRMERDNWDVLYHRAAAEIEHHLTVGITPLAISDVRYPALLRETTDPPPILYAKGDLDALRMTHAVAVIGTREPTTRGYVVAQRVAHHFASRNYCIVSGLAKGLDTVSHQGALEVGRGRTVAVMATTPDTIYPKENTWLADEICARGGALVSEYALGASTRRNSFVERDRIQAGMALAVIVVQTDMNGGSMHAVNAATKYHRLVLCPKPPELPDLQVNPEEASASQYTGIRHILNHPDDFGGARAFTSATYAEIEADLEALHARLISGFKIDHRDTAPMTSGAEPNVSHGAKTTKRSKKSSAKVTSPMLWPEVESPQGG